MRPRKGLGGAGAGGHGGRVGQLAEPAVTGSVLFPRMTRMKSGLKPNPCKTQRVAAFFMSLISPNKTSFLRAGGFPGCACRCWLRSLSKRERSRFDKPSCSCDPVTGSPHSLRLAPAFNTPQPGEPSCFSLSGGCSRATETYTLVNSQRHARLISP